MENNKGYEIEAAMKKWFKGENHPHDCVDFQTSKSLYEVKSCRLFNECTNGNEKRKYVEKPHKKIKTTQLGRFFINCKNHEKLLEVSKKENKIPKYIFVVLIGKQKFWSVKPWAEVDYLVNNKKDMNLLRIKDIFTEGI